MSRLICRLNRIDGYGRTRNILGMCPTSTWPNWPLATSPTGTTRGPNARLDLGIGLNLTGWAASYGPAL